MPTLRQQKAFEKLSEIVGKSPDLKGHTIGQILRDSGYSQSISETPSKVTSSKGWRELMEEHFPKEDLIKRHKSILNKQETYQYKGEVIKTGQPHSDVKYALSTLYDLYEVGKIMEGHPTFRDLMDIIKDVD